MSVIIHGMEMPNYCSECPMWDFGDICNITRVNLDFTDMYEQRPSFCPMEERKSGRWIDHYGDTLCSECKTVFKDLEYILDDGYPKFCPNCGAKMDGGENDVAND